jgi:hypothetical protein
VNTGDDCTSCWGVDDVLDFDNWDVRDNFVKEEAITWNDHSNPPFSLNIMNECNVACQNGFVLNSFATGDAPCGWANCKTMNQTDLDPAKIETKKSCATCWSDTQVADYKSWDAAEIYTIGSVTGIRKSSGFELEDTTKICRMYCEDLFWSNYQSFYYPATDGNEQRCNSKNCKNWDSSNVDGNPAVCTECWSDSEINDSTNIWPALDQYPPIRLIGSDLGFELNHSTGVCT